MTFFRSPLCTVGVIFTLFGCGEDPGPGPEGNRCQTAAELIFTTDAFITSLVIQPDAMYVGLRGRDLNGRIERIPLEGGLGELVAEVGNAGPELMVSDGARLFYDVGPEVQSVPLAGGTPDILATPGNSPSGLNDLEVQGDTLYWTNDLGQLVALPVGGGDPLPQIEPEPRLSRLEADASGLYVQFNYNENAPGTPMVEDGIGLVQGTAVAAITDFTGTGTISASLGVGPDSIYYFGYLDVRELHAVPKGGGGAEVLVSDWPTFMDDLTWADGNLYFHEVRDGNNHSVWRVPDTGGQPAALICEAGALKLLRVDSTYVYVVQFDADTGAILRVRR